MNAINIENATFSWSASGEDFKMEDINVKVGKGQLVAVVGTVGCGKSSLISFILGETFKHCGSVNTDGTIAYVAQEAWIQNATLQVRFKKFSINGKISKVFFLFVLGKYFIWSNIRSSILFKSYRSMCTYSRH